MTIFDHYIGKEIKEIVRVDSEEDYEFFTPLGILLTLNEDEGLFIGIDGPNSIDIRTSSDQELYADYGAAYSESAINKLKADDALNKLRGEKIRVFKIGCYNDKEIRGNNFVIANGKCSAVIIETENHSLAFYSDFGGHLCVDDEAEIPNKERWHWAL